MRRITMLSMLLVIALFSVLSCAPAVSQEEYDRVSNELSAIQGQLASLQGKLAEAESLQAQHEELNRQYEAVKGKFETAQTRYEELITEHEGLSEQFDTVKSEFETMQADYEELSADYEELNKQFEELSEDGTAVEEVAEINEEDVEQAVFKLVNQERTNNGLDELEWGIYLYKSAIAHSRYMATERRFEYPEYGWQEVFWATGYSTTDEIANAAFAVWKNRRLYETNFLNKVTKYGAVAVYKSGEIFYITYVADYFR